MKFNTLDLNEKMLQGIEDAGFEKCTPVQEQALPESIKGKDIIVQSQTGTGKTAVFITTIYNRLIVEGKERPKGARALVMAPTRELAVQIDTEAKKLALHLPFRSIAIYGGVEYEKQISALKKGVDLVVATPGRMIDLYKSKSLSLNDIEIFVVDEADRMFDMGFAPDISYIASRLPKGKDRQTMLFSATIDENVHRLAARYMKPEPVVVEIEPEQVTVDKIDQKVLYPSNDEKLVMLMALLRRPDVERAIIFCNMKRTVEMLEWKLTNNDFLAMGLTGDVSQSKRQRIIDDMKAGSLKILVATDVVARGLHVEDISHVYNYDLPQEAASYVHRIGRTARAGKSGKAYSLVCEDHAFNLPEIEKYIERKIPAEWIDEAEMLPDKAGSYRNKRSSKPAAGGRGGKGGGGAKSGAGRGRSSQGGSSKGGYKGGRKSTSYAVKPREEKKELSKPKPKPKPKTDEVKQGSPTAAKPRVEKKESSKPKPKIDEVKQGSSTEPKSKDGSDKPSRPRRSMGRRGGSSARANNKENSNETGQVNPRSRAEGAGLSGQAGAKKDNRKEGASPRRRSRSKPSSNGRRASSPSATDSLNTGIRSVGDSLIESQTGGVSITASLPDAVVPKSGKGMFRRILNVFGKK